ncbi:MAG: citrate/2-methylcitrate synthase, partial [Silvanigrellaceae bacterium]|nr:citrate/2-methylcitrate synthase [Silvanigrellaceae bacterium]
MHGGASELVGEMLKDAQASGDVRQFVKDLLHSGGKIMGMGHRAYKAVDPRARIFYDLLTRLAENEKSSPDIETLKIIEDEASVFFEKGGLPIFVNVDFWSGAVYRRLGIEPILFPAIFAAARMVGYCAHIIELRQDNKLYRPSSHYVGDLNVPYVPIEQR